jgi:ATP-binding cassette, subfamily C (CFTR/MRP), member 1
MEHGTFQELIAANGEFARLEKEYGANDSQPTEKPQATTTVAEGVESKSESTYKHAGGTGKLEGKLIVKERRITGSISPQGNSPLILISDIKLTFC